MATSSVDRGKQFKILLQDKAREKDVICPGSGLTDADLVTPATPLRAAISRGP